MQNLRFYFILILKGIAMGAANVVPGVSGGTIALITEIFERLINAIKSFDLTAVRLLLKGQIKAFAKHTDLYFLLSILLGVLIAIVSLARLFDYLFREYPVYIWAYFFGLVLASVFFVGKRISKISIPVVITFVIGTAIAIMISFMSKGQENDNFFYLMICGIAAICSMILPGLSGSFILFIMGNYHLVAIDAINQRDLSILFPMLIGAAFGLVAFSHFLSWVFKKFRDETIAILTGFILGSVSILWPWQREVYLMDSAGNYLLKDGERIVTHYSRYLPDQFGTEFWMVMVWVLTGILTIWLIEALAKKKTA
ncbi:MAG TPA: DUF368 domain-containing protein [Bacteroidales bacterium]|nr:DUF368 domain-containing protein [Bacteroidales bacterium]